MNESAITTASPIALSTARLEKARAMLAQAKIVEDVVGMLNEAEAMRVYLRREKASEEAQADCIEIIQHARRRLGQMSAALPKAPGKRTDKPGPVNGPGTKREVLTKLGISKQDANRFEKLAAMTPKEFAHGVERARERVKRETSPAAVTAVSAAAAYDGDEYGTPAKYVEPARAVLGGIDIDPASNAYAANIVRAKRHYTKTDSGLLVPWKGRGLWLNPPYSLGLIDQFIKKLCEELAAGRFKVGIILVNSSTETGWYQSLIGVSSRMCLPDHRIAFELDGVPIKQNRYAQTFFYIGDEVKLFEREFEQFGKVLAPVRRKPKR
jgi:hypothetical protein